MKERVLKFYLQFTIFKAMCHKICNPHIFINKPYQYPWIFDSFSAMVNIQYTAKSNSFERKSSRLSDAFLTILFEFPVMLVTTRRAGQRGAKTQSWAGQRIESDSVETESIGFGQDSTHRDSAYSRLTHLEGLWSFLKEQFSIYPLMQTFQVLTLESQSNMISSTVRHTEKSVEYLSKIDPKNATLFQKGRGGFDLKKNERSQIPGHIRITSHLEYGKKEMLNFKNGERKCSLESSIVTIHHLLDYCIYIAIMVDPPLIPNNLGECDPEIF